VSEQTVPLYLDEALELARILELFDEYTTRRGEAATSELASIAYGDVRPAHLAQTYETLAWAARMSLRLKHAARTATGISANEEGDVR
jgi:hypothetical protein